MQAKQQRKRRPGDNPKRWGQPFIEAGLHRPSQTS